MSHGSSVTIYESPFDHDREERNGNTPKTYHGDQVRSESWVMRHARMP